MFHLLIIIAVMLTATAHAASQRPTISTVQVGQLEAEYRQATNPADKTRILNTLQKSGFAHIADQLERNATDIIIEPRVTTQRVKRPAMPVAHTGYEIEEGAASLQTLFDESSPEQLQQEKELAYQRQREIEQQKHKEEQQKEAALRASKKQQEETKEFEQLLASLTKDVHKEGRSVQQMNVTMKWIDNSMGQLTRSGLAQEEKEPILGGFNNIKDLLAQKITATTQIAKE